MREALERVYAELIHRHHRAAREKRENDRERLYRMIGDMEWQWPEEIKKWEDRVSGAGESDESK